DDEDRPQRQTPLAAVRRQGARAEVLEHQHGSTVQALEGERLQDPRTPNVAEQLVLALISLDDRRGGQVPLCGLEDHRPPVAPPHGTTHDRGRPRMDQLGDVIASWFDPHARSPAWSASWP